MLLKIVRKFDCAHKLPLHKGQCSNLHGHTYKIVFLVEGKISADGMIKDFGELKKFLDQNLPDHQYLNDLMEHPTSENLAEYLSDKFSKLLKEKMVLKLKGLELWESDTCAVIKGDIS